LARPALLGEAQPQRILHRYEEVLPGAEQISQPHLMGAEEYVTVFAGSVRLRVGETDCLLEAGDSIRFKADISHSYHNEGTEKALVAMLIHYSE
jgi:uncharacterized cupin superfamily protein